ncbi:hypothetical protein BGLA2_370005 [Burkholderia gladioli]|nr:hypothetical protein BGLA2_370005 [Burkholderia gladioli]
MTRQWYVEDIEFHVRVYPTKKHCDIRKSLRFSRIFIDLPHCAVGISELAPDLSSAH